SLPPTPTGEAHQPDRGGALSGVVAPRPDTPREGQSSTRPGPLDATATLDPVTRPAARAPVSSARSGAMTDEADQPGGGTLTMTEPVSPESGPSAEAPSMAFETDPPDVAS